MVTSKTTKMSNRSNFCRKKYHRVVCEEILESTPKSSEHYLRTVLIAEHGTVDQKVAHVMWAICQEIKNRQQTEPTKTAKPKWTRHNTESCHAIWSGCESTSIRLVRLFSSVLICSVDACLLTQKLTRRPKLLQESQLSSWLSMYTCWHDRFWWGISFCFQVIK